MTSSHFCRFGHGHHVVVSSDKKAEKMMAHCRTLSSGPVVGGLLVMASPATPATNPSAYKLLLSCPSGLSRSQVPTKDMVSCFSSSFGFCRFWFEVCCAGIGGFQCCLRPASPSGCWYGGIRSWGEDAVLFLGLSRCWSASFEMKLLNCGDLFKLWNAWHNLVLNQQ